MPLLTLTVDVSGGERKLSVLVDSARDLDPVLKKYGATYLRHKVQERFEQEGPGWAPRSPATINRMLASGGVLSGKAAERAQGLLRRKLEREARRARRRLRAVEDEAGFAREARRQADRGRAGKRALSMAEVIRRRNAAVARREAVIKVFDAIIAGGAVEGTANEKVVAKLNDRLGRAEKRASSQLLGKIASSFKLTVKGGRLEYGSTIPWAGVHNEGGTVGHGATIKARPFAYLTDQDLDVLVDMIVAWLGRAVTVG